MKFLLSVIAVCLVMITSKLYIPEANADISYNDQYELLSSYDFDRAVERIIEDKTKNQFQLYQDYQFKEAVKRIIDDETKANFEEIEKVFEKLGNSMKEMIVDQCRVDGSYLLCPVDESKSLYKN
tara:strand:- start:273 stop:647 length:375 start_codon:yes stop_codon:yes gene_type:complete